MKPRRSKPNSRAIASLLPKVARQAYRRYGFAESKILTRWPEIVGATLAANTVPQRISFNRRSRIGGTLHLTTESAFATELKHLEPRLLERINSEECSMALLAFVGYYFQLRREAGQRVSDYCRGCDEREIFVDSLEHMIDGSPGIEFRYCYLDRRFAWLSWLLSKVARTEIEQELADIAINGESDFKPKPPALTPRYRRGTSTMKEII